MSLQQILLLSRHNMRTPTPGEQEHTKNITSYPWKQWDVAPGNLTLQGIAVEAGLGHYFRKYLEETALFTQATNYPIESIRFYANCTQRTIATAKAFATACFPMANIDIETHPPGLHGDPTFASDLLNVDERFKQQVMEEIIAKHGNTYEIMPNLQKNFETMFKVLGLLDTDLYKNVVRSLNQEEFYIILAENRFPELNQVLRMANSLSYALLEQYYSKYPPKISREDIKKIYALKDFYDSVTFATPSIGKQIAQPMLKVIWEELTNPQRALTFIAGHDTNINNIIAALDIQPYYLPDSIETRTPLGGKIVIEKYVDDETQSFYGKLYYLYPSEQQLSSIDYFHKHPEPKTIELVLKNLPSNEGIYPWEDLLAYIHQRIHC